MKDETDKSSIIKWEIIKNAPAYRGCKNNCKLYLEENLYISEPNKIFNKKTEFDSKCRYINKFPLCHLHPK